MMAGAGATVRAAAALLPAAAAARRAGRGTDWICDRVRLDRPYDVRAVLSYGCDPGSPSPRARLREGGGVPRRVRDPDRIRRPLLPDSRPPGRRAGDPFRAKGPVRARPA